MDRIKKIFFFTACGLISTGIFAQELPQIQLGKITQTFGKITYLAYKPWAQVQEIKARESFQTHGSYLTHDDSFLTAKLLEGSYLRASPNTKFSVDIDPASKTIYIHLYTGSLKLLFSQSLNQGKLQKLVVKSLDNTIETTEGKFSVVRSFRGSVNVFVEKGLVTAIRPMGDFQYVHSNEALALKGDGPQGLPQKMSEKERRFMHGNVYLRSIRKTL